MTQKKTTTKKECPAPVFQNIRGKNYETVASRIKRFRVMSPTYSLVDKGVARERIRDPQAR